jgi:Icc-related predicted phosphoesterase
MKIIAGADFHGDKTVRDWFVEAAGSASVDAVVLAGDLLGHPEGFATDEDAQRADGLALVDALLPLELPVLYIMGNDDLVELEAEERGFSSLQGVRVRCGEYAFVGYQFSLPFMGGRFEKPEEEISSDLAALESLIDSRTVLVTHSPAYEVLDPGFLGRRIGSPSLRALTEKLPVRAHIHGHSHAGFGRQGIHFNVASGRRNRAMVIDLQSMVHEVLYSTSVGSDT